ncbi:MAG: carboxypeptidase-like regulatory domain-containing protein, partial [Muribaculaceae bacterium]|nr:carboxypeptidase-like regulatory domain-containing protein [Muribaculaceae bacterium]
MKHYINKLAAFMAAMMMTLTTLAQVQGVSGKVIDEKGEPMAFANVVLLSLPDSAYVQGTITEEDGSFNITSSKPGHLLKVSSIGYQTQCVNATPSITVPMKEETVLLGEVVVKSTLPKTRVKGEA